jgi:hypothetical protein
MTACLVIAGDKTDSRRVTQQHHGVGLHEERHLVVRSMVRNSELLEIRGLNIVRIILALLHTQLSQYY